MIYCIYHNVFVYIVLIYVSLNILSKDKGISNLSLTRLTVSSVSSLCIRVEHGPGRKRSTPKQQHITDENAVKRKERKLTQFHEELIDKLL